MDKKYIKFYKTFHWVFKSREDRNNFMDVTAGMKKAERENYFTENYEKVLP